MKHCAYCGRENSDEALCCSEFGTDEFKETLTTNQTLIDSDADFTEITELALSDAKEYLRKLEDEGIPFKLISLDSKLQEMDIFSASVGGSFGTALNVRIYTRLVDTEKVQKIWREFCNLDESDA